MAQYLEKHVHRKIFLLNNLTILDKFGQVEKDWKPETLENTKPDLILIWLHGFFFRFLLQGGFKTILRRLITHLFKVSLVKVSALLADEIVEQARLFFEVICTQLKKLLCFHAELAK